ncbi:Protein kinase domain [Carpediemonas membranifera]|uniref:Protein kinase domain n=1 Tax=Carpediemonas membranifera TaxID=201153 RepID=A0A8J6AX37_9EUKA|nr:Protein kinase domain [Carpediemonas membranifera]|eukprot:KAG9397021.1 Protein kinase domain [Carpediemonas membranifera]
MIDYEQHCNECSCTGFEQHRFKKGGFCRACLHFHPIIGGTRSPVAPVKKPKAVRMLNKPAFMKPTPLAAAPVPFRAATTRTEIEPAEQSLKKRIAKQCSECRAVDDMIRDATTRVITPEDKLHINPIGSSPLTVADLSRVLNLFSVVPAAFSMRLTEPDLTVTMKNGKLAADKPDSAVDDLLAAWHARMAECIQTMKGHTNWVLSVAFLPDGTMVTGSWDGTTKLWDKRGVCKESMEHGGKVRCIAVSPDGSTIASSGDNRKIKLWSKRGRLVKTLEGHTNNVNSLAFSRDGKTLVSGSFDKTVRSWDVATGEYRTMKGHSNWVLSVAISPDRKTIVSESLGDTIRVWDAESGRLEQTLEGHKNCVITVAISPDGKSIVSGSDEMIKVWDAESGRLEQTLEGHTNSVTTVAISPDGALLASGSWDKTTRLWDTRTWECVAVLRGHASFVNSVAFSPDGRTLASGSDDNTVKLWSIGSGECFETLRGHDHWVRCVVFSPDGSTLLSGSDDKTAKQWHIKHSPEIEEVCAQPTLGADIRLPSDDSPLYLADLARVVIHILATGLPRSFEMRLAHPHRCRVSMDRRKFLHAEKADDEVTKVLEIFNAIRCEARPRAVTLSGKLKAHPLLACDTVPVQVTPCLTALTGRLGQARRSPDTRMAEYQAVIAQARDAVRTLEGRAGQYSDAQALVKRVKEYETRKSLPSVEVMADVLKAADEETLSLGAEIKAGYAVLRDFLQPHRQEHWQYACKVAMSEDNSKTLRELHGFLATAEDHVVAFTEAADIMREFRRVGDAQHLQRKIADLEDDIRYLMRHRKHAQIAETEQELADARARFARMQVIIARCTPKLVRLCPELRGITDPPASLFAELRKMGLAHLMDLPEMRADLSLSDFTVESTISENRAQCQIVTRDGQTFFAKTFKLDNEHQRKLCDREAGILSRMAHSPAVPRLHFVLVNLAEQTCTIVMERLERPLRDAPADSPDSLRRLLHGLLTAIHDLHSAGICHRDLKPENVMLREGHPVFVDFETASNMDAVNMTATGVNMGTLAFSAPEEIAARTAGKKLKHREHQAADVYHAGLTMLGAMAPDYPAFCQMLLSLITSDLAAASTVNEDSLCTALLATVAVPDALCEVLSGMLATHPEARWSVRRALADGLFAASANELDPEVDLNAASNRFSTAHAFVDAIDRARLQMFREDPLDLALDDNLSNTLTNIGACEEDLLAVPATLSGKESAKALPDLVVELPRVTVRQTIGAMRFSVPIFREGTLVFMPDALDYPIDDLRPVLLGLGRVLQLMLLDGIRLPADMVSNAWLVALAGGRIDLAALMPLVDRALQRSIAEAAVVCPLDGFEGDRKAYRSDVLSRFTDRMQLIRSGMTARTEFSEMIAALTAAQLRALLVRPNPLTVDAVMAVLRFPADSQGVQDALRAVLEDDETRRRFAFHLFGGQLPQPGSVGVTLHEHHRVYADCAGGVQLPRLEDAGEMRQAVLDSAPATAGTAADFYVIPRRQQAYSRAEIRTLVEQNDILQTCPLVTLGRGAAVDVPVIRRCPTCGELTSREGDLNSCKMSTCPCGQDFCHKCLLRVANHEEHMAHYGGQCEMAPRQTVDLPEGVTRELTVTCPWCHRSATVSANRRQVTCSECGRSINARAV